MIYKDRRQKKEERGQDARDTTATQSGFEGSDAFTDGVFGEFSDTVDLEFFHNIAPVRFDGLAAYVKMESDLLGAFAFSNWRTSRSRAVRDCFSC